MAQTVSPRRTVCDRRPGPVIFVVDKVALEQVFVRALSCCSCQNDGGGEDFGNLKKNAVHFLKSGRKSFVLRLRRLVAGLSPAVLIPAKCM
jgi:hypothetical protein